MDGVSRKQESKKEVSQRYGQLNHYLEKKRVLAHKVLDKQIAKQRLSMGLGAESCMSACVFTH
ncbi:hypothetical protein [Neptunomonas antarctica]|uniref:hypothetical protein n=1 Tax=Neptunomonas antarctica TaxID=619304 RepID=UPI0006C7CC6F|nr:hypothetical protein [Neptunomonas antarctica]